MFTSHCRTLAAFTVLLVLPPATRTVAGSEASDFELCPETTLMVLQASDPGELISLVFDHPLRSEIEQLEPYRQAIDSQAYRRFLLGRTVVEAQVQMPWREALETFLAQGVTVAFDGATNGLAVVVRGKDGECMKLLGEKLLEFAKLRPNPDSIQHMQYRDVDIHQVDQVQFAVVDDRIILTNQATLGEQILDRLLDGGKSLADNETFQQALEQRSEDALVWSFVDVSGIRESGLAKAVFGDRIDNPVVEMIVGGVQSTLNETPYLIGSLRADHQQVDLDLQMPHQSEWVPETREYFFGPGGSGRAPKVPSLPETVFSLGTYRDFSQVWMRAGDLFDAATNDSLAQADASLTTLFAGNDFGEDILGSFEPEVGFVAARQTFEDRGPVPTIKLPAFAAVFELREPETMTRELRRTFQSLVGFLNVVGAMNGQRQLELDMEMADGGGQLVSSSYVPEAGDLESDNAEIVFNFSPSIGFRGSRCVISSSRDLAYDLIEAGESSASSEDNTYAQLNAQVLRDVLADNRSQLVAQNMLEDGNPREEAEATIDLLLQAVQYFDGVSVRFGDSDDQLRLAVSLRVKS